MVLLFLTHENIMIRHFLISHIHMFIFSINFTLKKKNDNFCESALKMNI